jgi:hypothetical protein
MVTCDWLPQEEKSSLQATDGPLQAPEWTYRTVSKALPQVEIVARPELAGVHW